MIEAYKKFLKNYSNFTGRTNRPDYWWVFLANLLLALPFHFTLFFRFIGAFAPVLSYTGDNGLVELSDSVIVSIVLQELFSPFTLTIFTLFLILNLALLVPSLAIEVR